MRGRNFTRSAGHYRAHLRHLPGCLPDEFRPRDGTACGVTVGGQLRALRRLLYCGEWIESHVLHVYMLHAPDFLGYPDAITLAKDYPEVVKNGAATEEDRQRHRDAASAGAKFIRSTCASAAFTACRHKRELLSAGGRSAMGARRRIADGALSCRAAIPGI